MTSYVAWNEIRSEHVARAGGEDAVERASARCWPKSSDTASLRYAAPGA
jgi:hypothetical protein